MSIDEGNLARERESLQKTAVELARWQGQVAQQVKTNTTHLDAINGSLDSIDRCTTEIKVELGVLRTKVALGSAIGGLLGAGAVTVILNAVG